MAGLAEQGGAARRILRNAASIVLGDTAGDLLTGYAIVIAATSLGPHRFGILSEAQAFMEPFDAAAALGLSSVALRFAACRGGCDGTLRGTILGIRMIGAIVAASLGIVIAFLTNRGELWPLLVAIAAGMLLAPANLGATLPFQWHQSLHRRIAVPFLVGALRVCAAYGAFRLLSSPLGQQLAILVAAVGSVVMDWWWAGRIYPDPLRLDWGLAKRLLAVGWPAAAFGCIVVVYCRAGYFLLRSSGAQEQGLFAAADRLTRPIVAIAAALFVSALPTFSAMAVRSDFTRLRVAYRRSLVGAAVALTPLLVVSCLLASWLLTHVTPAYGRAVGPFRVLTLGTFFIVLNVISTIFLTAMGRFRVMTAIAIVDLAIYLALATHLIPTYGAIGAAFSTTIMEGVNVIMQVAVVCHALSQGSALGGSPDASSRLSAR